MSVLPAQLSKTLHDIYSKNPAAAHKPIEAYLEEQLGNLPAVEKLEMLDRLSGHIAAEKGINPTVAQGADDQLLHFLSRLTGQSLDTLDSNDPMLQERLIASLETIFAGVNDLLQAIHSTISQEDEFDQTIRQVIRHQLDEQEDNQPLTACIDQIKASFFMSYESFKLAHKHTLDKILAELDPQKSLKACSGGLKIGTLRKAEAFEHYTQAYKKIADWHESGRGQDEYLRTFEKQCSVHTQQNKEKRF